jgi:hypothetical protein
VKGVLQLLSPNATNWSLSAAGDDGRACGDEPLSFVLSIDDKSNMLKEHFHGSYLEVHQERERHCHKNALKLIPEKILYLSLHPSVDFENTCTQSY